jgi:hypothetical protein
LDEYGGAAAVSYDNRLLSVICDLDQDNFGSPNGKTPRKRRKQCQNFVYQFSKMDPLKQAAKRAQILSYKSDSPAVVRPFIVSPELPKSFAERNTKSIKAKSNTHVQREPTKKEVADVLLDTISPTKVIMASNNRNTDDNKNFDISTSSKCQSPLMHSSLIVTSPLPMLTRFL